jgi:hypothetical protein
VPQYRSPNSIRCLLSVSITKMLQPESRPAGHRPSVLRSACCWLFSRAVPAYLHCGRNLSIRLKLPKRTQHLQPFKRFTLLLKRNSSRPGPHRQRRILKLRTIQQELLPRLHLVRSPRPLPARRRLRQQQIPKSRQQQIPWRSSRLRRLRPRSNWLQPSLRGFSYRATERWFTSGFSIRVRRGSFEWQRTLDY